MNAVKIEPSVVEAVRRHIEESSEILSSDLVKKLRDHENYAFDVMQVLEIIKNHLADFVDLRKDNENRIVFAWKDELQRNASKFRLSQLEQAAFKHIHDAAESGMKSTWMRDKLKIPQREVKAVLERLVEVKLIKKTPIGKRIMFHRSDVELDELVNGNFFYDDKKPDQDAIEVTRKLIVDHLSKRVGTHITSTNKNSTKQYMPILWNKNCGSTAAEITEFINAKKVMKGNVKERDIFQVLETLRYDDLIGNFEDGQGIYYYLVNNSYPEFFGYSHVPCCVCPVKTECKTGANVNPENCDYLTSWLNDF